MANLRDLKAELRHLKSIGAEKKEIIALEKRIGNQEKKNAANRKARQKEAKQLEKDIEKINLSQESIQKRINDSIKAKEGSIGNILKSAIKLDLSTASELLNRRSIAKESKKMGEAQQGVSTLLTKQVQDGKINVSDQRKVLGIQEGIASGKIKSEDIDKRLAGLSGKFSKNGKAYGEMLKGQAKSQSKIGGLISKSSGGLAKWGAKLGAFGAIAVGVYNLMAKFAAKIDEVGKTFGFLTSKNEQFRGDLIAAGNEAIMIGKNLGDVLSVTAQLSSEFGITLDEAVNLSRTVLDTAVATGISNDEATKLFGTFMQIGDLTAQQAEDLIENTAQLAAQRGVAPTAVLRDMAGSAEEIAGYTKGTGENIAEAAIQARQLGISLSTTAKLSDGLLDFQTSIANEVEASVMIGRRLNYQKARQLALEGDMAGAVKEVVKQLGSEEELNKLNVLERRSIAKSINMSVADMTKLVRGQEKLTLSTALAGEKFEDLVGQDSLSTLTSIVNSLKSLGATLLDTFGGPLNALLEKFRNTFTGPEGVERMRATVRSIGSVMIKLLNGIISVINFFSTDNITKLQEDKIFGALTPTNDYRGGRGGISMMAGPAGVFRLNPMDSVIATTNPIPTNDYGPQPAGSVGMTQKVEVTGTITGTRDSLMAVIEPALG